MNNRHLRTLILTGIFCGCCLTALHGQQPIPRPEVVAGPWEFAGPSGIEGIFLSISTHAEGTADLPIVTNQTVNVRIYHRQDGQETWGWYRPMPCGRAEAPPVVDGQHLCIRSVNNGPALDLVFHAETNRWTGTWTRGDQPQDVVLERPRPPSNFAPTPLTGSWDGVWDASRSWKARTRLHIDQSSDGVLTVWMDRDFGLINQRHGELLRLVSLKGRGITLDTTSAGGRRYRFQGTLTADGLRLSGVWDGGGVGTLNASESFRRMP